MDSPPAPARPSDDSEPVRDEASGEAERAPDSGEPGAPVEAEKEALVETAPADGDEVPSARSVAMGPAEEPVAVHKPPSTALLAGVAFIVAAADIGTKEWAKIALATPDLRRSGKHITGIPNYLDFIFAQNPGGAWSFLRGMPDGLRRPFFLFVSAAAIVFIVTVYRRLDRRQWAMRWGLPLALGGAIGNLHDRVRYGWVVDFIDMYWKRGANETHWPTFNVADIAIVFGVGLMALDLLSLRRSHDAPPGKAAAETASDAA